MSDPNSSLPSEEWNKANESIPDFVRTTDGRAMLMTPLVEVKTHRGKVVRAFGRFDWHDPETGDILNWQRPVKNSDGETEMWADDHVNSWRPSANSPYRDVKPFSILHSKNEPIKSAALNDVMTERAKQDEKWGEQNHSDFVWCAIAGEELGEVQQAALHDQFGGAHAGTVRGELVQLAAVCLQWIECIDRKEPEVKS